MTQHGQYFGLDVGELAKTELHQLLIRKNVFPDVIHLALDRTEGVVGLVVVPCRGHGSVSLARHCFLTREEPDGDGFQLWVGWVVVNILVLLLRRDLE